VLVPGFEPGSKE